MKMSGNRDEVDGGTGGTALDLVVKKDLRRNI